MLHCLDAAATMASSVSSSVGDANSPSQNSRDPNAPPFLMSQPTASQQAANQAEWTRHFQQIQQLQMRDAVANNAPHNQRPVPPPLPHGLFPSPPPVPHVTIPSQGNEKKKSPAKRKETKRTKVEEKELPVELRGFRYEHRHRLECEKQMDPKNKVDPGPYKVAKHIVAGRGDMEKKWDLESLNSTQLRKLAIQFGCKGAGGKTKFNCRQQMALCKEGGTLCGNVDIPNPTSSAQEKKLNTLLRILNAAFSPSMVDRLIHLNDTKGRKDFEASNGGNPVKSFFTDLSEMVNDPLNDDDLKLLVDSDEDENEVLHSLVANDIVNLTDFTQQTHKSAQQNLCDMMKARERCRKAACSTGNHDADLWGHCGAVKFTKIRKDTIVPAAAVCCCEVLCLKCPDIDGSFAEALSENLRSDSTSTPLGSASSPTSGSSSRQSVAATIEKCFSGLQEKKGEEA